MLTTMLNTLQPVETNFPMLLGLGVAMSVDVWKLMMVYMKLDGDV